VTISHPIAGGLGPSASISFGDDEPVFGPGHELLDGVAGPLFGHTDVWSADCIRRPSNRCRGAWRLLLPQTDPAWNLRIREVAFAMLNPSHPALRAAGVCLVREPAKFTTVIGTARKLGQLMDFGIRNRLPDDLQRWTVEDWNAFLDERAAALSPSTLSQDVLGIRLLHTFAPVLTGGGLLEDLWPGQPAAKVANRTHGSGLSTPSIPPATWWPLLRGAWTYIHMFAPDIIALQDGLSPLPGAAVAPSTPIPQERSHRPAEVDRLLDCWLADPANLVPVHARPWSGQPAGTPLWTCLSLLVTDGTSQWIFMRDRSVGQVRRRAVQQAVDAGRVRLVNGPTAAQALGLSRPTPRRHIRTPAELDHALEEWLADPTHRIPIRGRGHPSTAPVGTPIWGVLERLVYGSPRTDLFRTSGGAGRRRRRLVEDVAAGGRVEILGGRATHRERTIPCEGFAAVSRPDGTRAPWRTEITLEEFGWELRMIRAACYIFIAALSLMRDSELQEIERGALTTHYGSPAVKSRKIKHDPSEPERHWWIIEPVAEAMAVAERLSWHDTHLFATINPPVATPGEESAPARRGRRGRRGIDAAEDIDFFITQANATRTRTGLEEIPPTRVRPHMFRRTMAIIASQEPDSEIALGLQLKHAARRALANRTTQGYSQMDTAWANEFDTQLELAAARRLVELLKARRAGEAIAVGPGAARMHAGLDRVIAKLDQDPTLRAQLADEQVELMLLRDEFPNLHFGTINHCNWVAADAECQNALPEQDRGQAPLLGACQPARCRNSVVTRSHAPIWLAEEEDLARMLRTDRLAAPRREALEARLTDVQRITRAWRENDEDGND
jgi:hypothetical protein